MKKFSDFIIEKLKLNTKTQIINDKFELNEFFTILGIENAKQKYGNTPAVTNIVKYFTQWFEDNDIQNKSLYAYQYIVSHKDIIPNLNYKNKFIIDSKAFKETISKNSQYKPILYWEKDKTEYGIIAGNEIACFWCWDPSKKTERKFFLDPINALYNSFIGIKLIFNK